MVRAYFPQSAVGNIDTNTNYPPQGELFGGVIPPEFLDMLFESGETMAYEDVGLMEYEGSGPPDDWFDTTFKRRVLITIQSGQVFPALGSQTDFPFVFNSVLSDLILGNVQPNGEDIRFVALDKTEFKTEVEKMDLGTTTLQAHSKIPSIQNGTQFFMYYGNSNALPPTDTADVWTNYSAVYHLNQTTFGANSTKDSTSNANDGTPVLMDATNVTAGQINGALEFNGIDECITVPDDTTLDPVAGPLSVSVWFRPDVLVRDDMVGKQRGDGLFDGWVFRKSQSANDNKLTALLRDSQPVPVAILITGTSVAPMGSLTIGHFTYDGSGNSTGLNLYFNGALETSAIKIGSGMGNVQTNVNLDIANQGNTAGNQFFDGILDEVRISKDEKTADFIKTEFNNQSNPDGVGGFYTVGAVQVIS